MLDGDDAARRLGVLFEVVVIGLKHSVDVLVTSLVDVTPLEQRLLGLVEGVRICVRCRVYDDTTLLSAPDSVEMCLKSVTHRAPRQCGRWD